MTRRSTGLDYSSTTPRDIPYGIGKIAVVWHKRRWRCRESLCPRQSFTESIAQVPPRARTTRRLREAVGDANRAVAEVAAAFGVSWPTAHTAFCEVADRELTAAQPTRILGIDETRRGRPRWEQDTDTGKWRLVDRWHSGFVDLAGDQGLLGQVLGRASTDVTGWLREQDEAFCAGVEFVAIDPCAAYRRAVAEQLPQAQIVVDHFHLVRLANAAVTDVRRRVSWDNRGRRGRKIDPDWRNRRRLLTGRERLDHKRFATMWNGCLDGDPSGQILLAWIAKEELRALLATARTGGHRHDISHRLYRFYSWCATADVPEITRLAQTVEDWWPEIEAFCRTRITNARTEGTNRLIKDVGRRACGFRNPDNQRRRVRYFCTRQSRRSTARLKALPGQV
ncbi:MAG TPA: ISL3 family transposase [Nocardioidaceae bacterium]|nr:ISL3 family transposase [Nocardioidaceae bacterium]